MVEVLFFLLLAFVVGLSFLVFFLFSKNQLLEKKINDLVFLKSSQAVKFGKTSEQFLPFLESVPFSASNFRFIGAPVDGIAFEENEIIFCEFKTGFSVLSEKQKKIKKLVEEKKVKWFSLHIS